MSKKVLITGISGFIGANCLEQFLNNTDWNIVGLVSFLHKGQASRLEEIRKNCGPLWDRVKIYRHDLNAPIDRQLENQILERRIDDRGVVREKHIDYILNFASESDVERSVTDPRYVWENNCACISTMLDFARVVKEHLKLFIHISTDEVYGECMGNDAPHKEWGTILPSNPYSASKAAQEALCVAYWRCYDLPLCITNCANVIGPLQHAAKFLPKAIQCIASGDTLPVYASDIGTPNQTIGSRIYLDVRNKADALLFLTKMRHNLYKDDMGRPDKYNITGEDELSNLALAEIIAEKVGTKLNYKLVESESARPGYDRRYAIDGTKLKELGWEPPYSLEECVENIVKFTMSNPHWYI